MQENSIYRHKLKRKTKIKVYLPECWVDIPPLPIRILPRLGDKYQATNIPDLQGRICYK